MPQLEDDTSLADFSGKTDTIPRVMVQVWKLVGRGPAHHQLEAG
jgi:hypothetical protein